MPQRRKLQVFVSSTYIDMIEERQAAVEAILQAGHIPAGMELFAGANEDQMNIIKRWIDDSDIFLLLLSGRYGSIDPKSKKSYTHLEFEYAKKNNKKIVVAVASDSYLYKKESEQKGKNSVLEKQNTGKFENFKNKVTSKYARSWDNIDALKLLVINAIRTLEDNPNLVGWIPGDQATNSAEIANQLARLIKENSDLKDQITKSINTNNTLYNGFTFDQMYSLLDREVDILDMFDLETQSIYGDVAKIFGDKRASLLHIFFIWGKHYINDNLVSKDATSFSFAVPYKLYELGILNKINQVSGSIFKFSTSGLQFYLRLRLERDEAQANKVFDELYYAYRKRKSQNIDNSSDASSH